MSRYFTGLFDAYATDHICDHRPHSTFRSVYFICFKTNSCILYSRHCKLMSVLHGAASGCYNPEWKMYEDQNSVGASQYHGPQSVQECLDHCGSLSNCVAADVDLTQDPPACWPHLSADDLLSENVYSQPGTNQYRLTNRCATGPITGLWIHL